MLPTQWVGLTLIILSVVWCYFMVLPISPVKKYWWAVEPHRLSLVLLDGSSFDKSTGKIQVYVGFSTLDAKVSVEIERIWLDFGKTKVVSDWEKGVPSLDRQHIYFSVGSFIKGIHRVRLIARTEDGIAKSQWFNVNIQRD